MATAAAGTTGSLSTTDMRMLLKATDEIETLAVTTANHMKALTDRSDGSKQLLESFRKTLHSTLLLYAVFGSLPEKRGTDVEPTCNQVQVAAIHRAMAKTPTGVDEDDPQGWPVEGSEVVVLDAPSSQSYRLGYDDIIVVVPRDSVKVNKMVLKFNPAVQHVTMAFSRKEIEKDGVLHMELMQLSARAAGMLFLPDNYNGWEVE